MQRKAFAAYRYVTPNNDEVSVSCRPLSRPWAAGRGYITFRNPSTSESPLARILGVRMDLVYPVNLLQRLGRRDIEINHDRLLVIAHDDTAKWFVLARIDLLMGNERWHVDEVARPSFGNELEALPPPHPRPTTYHVDHALQFPMVMGTCFSVRVDLDGTRPQFVCAGRGMRNSRRTCHTRRLGGVEI